MKRLQDKVALITGGASGIGLGAAQIFLQEGATVVLVDRDDEQLAAAQESLQHEKLSGIRVDLKDDDSHARYVQETADRCGRIDVAVFNAGIPGLNMPLEEYPVAVFDEVMQVNLRAAWLGLRAVIPVMKAQKSGSILFTSSIQGLAALPGTTAYTVCKHALVGMMKGAALELAPHGIRVNSVHPGYVNTPMMDRIHHEVVPDDPQAFEQALSGTVPMGRYASAQEIGRLMAFLASEDASYSTGSCFTADGGMLAGLPLPMINP